MKEKSTAKKKKRDKNSDSIGIFSSIDKQDTSFFEQKDNSWWWTYALLLVVICLTAIWALTTFAQ